MSNSDWIYCQVVDRATLILPRPAYSFGPVELASEPEQDARCAAALKQSMTAFDVAERAADAPRLLRARLTIQDETREQALQTGAIYLMETLRLFDAYMDHFGQIKPTEAGYLYDLRARLAFPFEPPRQSHSGFGAFLIMDDAVHHPAHTLNTLLVTRSDMYGGELGLAFRRAAHWRHLATETTEESQKLLLNWMAAECLAKMKEGDHVGTRLLAAVGLPAQTLKDQLPRAEREAIDRLPNLRPRRSHLLGILEHLRDARNAIVHAGYRHVDIPAMLTEEERGFAERVLPLLTKSVSDMALMAVNHRVETLQAMWAAYPAHLRAGSGGAVAAARWFLERLDDLS